ncbi:MAG TPA: cation-transporting P-type ATPase [Solirubrobacterales bacterium]|nr:cation-transporting P-type ATPase [Solirubrobacterales bacterium]
MWHRAREGKLWAIASPTPFHAATAKETVTLLGSDAGRGLDVGEAAARRERFGPNSLPEEAPIGVMALITRQFRDAFVLLLLGAAAVAALLGEWIDTAMIAAIVILNAALGTVQEGRADRAARAVRSLLSPRAVVVRDGSTVEVDAVELVPGDVILLVAGDRVPADGRLLEATRLELDESSMTGESVPVGKRAEPPAPVAAILSERPTVVLCGTTVTRGRARVLVTATGANTELARIAAAARRKPPPTPLERRLDRLARQLLVAVIAACFSLAALLWIHGESLGASLGVGVALAVAAVPEGLVAVVTITLALGMRRLTERGAVVRRLRAVETLGSTTVICTDKTGTLTTNRMTVARLLATPGATEEELLQAAVIASEDAHDPGEAAIAAAAGDRGLRRAELLRDKEIAGGEPFDSERKRMSVVVAGEGEGRSAYVKGAPEAILPCLLDPSAAAQLEEEAETWAAEGIRVLMIARRDDLPPGADPERQLEPLGLIGLVDPVRDGALESVETARQAGIRTIMITGDHPRTALAVARACGIAPATQPILITGPELEETDDADLRERIRTAHVLARVVPEHKSRVVAALQEDAEVVAMTGDGVNDVPALAAADIGVAMGRGGSDAAIDAAELVLTDNSYPTLVAAVEGGRRIYANVVRFINFLLAANAGEVLLFALAVLPGLGAPLTVAQILLINLLTNGLPAVALGLDPADRETMRRPPRPTGEGLLGPMRWRLTVGALITGAAAFAAFLIGSAESDATAQTMAFTTVVFAQLGYVYAVRGDGLFLRTRANWFLNGAVVASALVAVAALAVPAFRDALSTVALSTGQLLAALSLATAPLIGTEVFKAMQRLREGRAQC